MKNFMQVAQVVFERSRLHTYIHTKNGKKNGERSTPHIKASLFFLRS